MEISKCIKNARQKNKISQKNLAEKLGVSRQTISSWENGKSYPDIVSVIKMSDIFDISLDKMLKEDENLIHHMQEKMDTVNSNQSVIFTILFALIFFGGIYFIRTFVEIPRINDVFSNSIILISFIIGVIISLLSNLSVGKLLNQKTSNKTIIKTMIIVFAIISLLIFFSLLERMTIVRFPIFFIRIIFIFGIIIFCFFLFKKIDNY